MCEKFQPREQTAKFPLHLLVRQKSARNQLKEKFFLSHGQLAQLLKTEYTNFELML